MRYFVAGNIWTFIALVIFLLRDTQRTDPLRVSFLGLGTWFSPAQYNAIALLVFVFACSFFVTGWRLRKRT